jgi:hypothetical protein
LWFGDYGDSVGRSCTACSTPLEHPNVVLIMIGAALVDLTGVTVRSE